MASERRAEKLNMLLQEEIARILDREAEIPEGSLLTVTRVQVSSDVHYASVFVSILGNDPKGVIKFLRKNVYAIQQALNRKVRMRPVPKIRFSIDEGEYERERVERSLAKLKKEEEI